tara:strand:- start:536 stop:1060 length:525 start_codon:yes stop_codon:yes gene_type:complete
MASKEEIMQQMQTLLGKGATSDKEMSMMNENLKMASGGGATSELEIAAIKESIADLETMKDLVSMGMTPEQAMDEISRMKTSPVNPSAFSGAVEGAASAGGMGALGAMSDKDMAAFLQAQVAKSREDRGMGALSGVPAGNQMPMPRPTMMPQSMGQDRTFNPMDRITPTNAPST